VAGTLEFLLLSARREIKVRTEEIEGRFTTARAPDHGLPRSCLVTGDVRGKQSALRYRVVVQEEEQFTPRDGRAAIACCGDGLDVCALEPHLERPWACRDRDRRGIRIRRDDDDFNLNRRRYGSGERFQHSPDRARLRPVGEDDAEPGWVRHDRDERADRRARQ
jgi:hypothetical protein